MGAPRCPECNKFCSLEMEEPELDSCEADEGVLYVNVRLLKNCADCGTEVREAYLELEIPFVLPDHDEDDDMTFEIEEEPVLENEEKCIGKGRYMRTEHGVSGTARVKCMIDSKSDSKETVIEVPITIEDGTEAAGNFEDTY